jgi:hypothetical protein
METKRYGLYEDPTTHTFSMQVQNGGEWVKYADSGTRPTMSRELRADIDVEVISDIKVSEKIADLVRDAFYDGCEASQLFTAPRTRMREDELFAAWMESESRKQLMAVFPALANGVRSA